MLYSSLFRSRWLALLWSIGILWSAMSFVGSGEPQGDPGETNAADDGGASLDELQSLVRELKAS